MELIEMRAIGSKDIVVTANISSFDEFIDFHAEEGRVFILDSVDADFNDMKVVTLKFKPGNGLVFVEKG